MIKADRAWEHVQKHFSPSVRSLIQPKFRRIVRQYYSFHQGGAYDPQTGRISKKVLLGEVWVYTGGRHRRRQRFMGARPTGRPSGKAVEYLVNALAILWVTVKKQRTTISHARYQHIPTDWEKFLCEALVRLGIGDCRRHAEKHSAATR